MSTSTNSIKPCGGCGKGTPATAAYGSVRIQKAVVTTTLKPLTMPSPSPLLSVSRIYVSACKDSRIAKLPQQLVKLQLPYTIEKELPTQKSGNVYFDPPSRRFRDQVTKSVTRPLLWLEDDIDIPYDFLSTWQRYENNLPADWKVAVLGWGLVYDNEDIKIRRVSEGWWHIEGGTVNYAAFSGAQAILVNAGEWRTKLADKEFRCDVGLCTALKSIGVTEIYHTDKVLIGTNDPVTTFGDAVVQYDAMSEPRYFGWKTGYREIRDTDRIPVIDS